VYVAAQNGHIDIVVWLTGESKASVDQAAKDGATPMFIAAQNGHIEIVVWLVGEGKASVDQGTKNGVTPLHVATHNGHIKVTRWLIEVGKAKVDHVSELVRTPLFAAVQRCSVAVIRQANSEATPLSTAGYTCDMDMLRWFVEEGHANVNTVSTSGATPLLAALCAEVVNMEVVQFLLSVGARVGDLEDTVFNSYARASIQMEIQKLEVLTPTLFLYRSLSPYPPSFVLQLLLVMC
jgi:ankyrin repeat protein